jgi:hypothetical protein
MLINFVLCFNLVIWLLALGVMIGDKDNDKMTFWLIGALIITNIIGLIFG